ncbi:MAG: VOC family protein, partial [Candidatus Dormiibacterota bacterium]
MRLAVSLDCADPVPLSTFWAELLGGEVLRATDD